MMQKFNSIVGFLANFKDEKTCIKFFESIRFKDGEYCPHCGYTSIYRFEDGRYRCAGCHKDFTIKIGTIFGGSKISLQKWFIAIYLLTSNKEGISSVQLAKQVGVTQKTAWFMEHRIRNAMPQGKEQLFGITEVDKTYIDGKEKNKHLSKRMGGMQGRNTDSKVAVFGMIQRNADVRATVFEDAKMITVEKHIVHNIKIGSTLYTDEFPSCNHIGRLFTHKKVDHSRGQYASKGNVHSNSAESFWAIFKRGYIGIYHSMSKKHLQRYVNEFTYRFNSRKEEFESVFTGIVNNITVSNRLSYKMLIQ